MFDQMGQQGSLPNHADPLLTVEGITAKRNALFKVSVCGQTVG